MNVYGNLIRAQLEAKTSDYPVGLLGSIWIDTTLDKVKLANGALIKSFLLNDDKIIVGTNATAATNVRLFRAGVGLLQFVPGNDVTVEGSLSTTLAQTSSRFENYTNAARPAFGNAGRPIWNTDQLKVQIDTGSTWIDVGTGGGGNNFELLRQKFHNEHYGNLTPAIAYSAGSGFGVAQTPIAGALMENYTDPATTVSIAWDPYFLNDSDKYTSVTTNFTIENAAVNLGTSATRKIGPTSVSFDKDNSSVNAGIVYDKGAIIGSAAGHTELLFWINLPSITQLLNVQVAIDRDGVNIQTFTQTTTITGAALAVGWNLMRFDLSTGGVVTGFGWNSSLPFQYVHLGVNTSVAGQTYTGILINAVHFSAASPEQLVPVGTMFTIADSSNIGNFQISSASPRNSGTITLTSALGNNFLGGPGTSVKRSTLAIAGNGMAAMVDGLSGVLAQTQVVRSQAIFPTSVTATFQAFSDINTNMVFPVTAVPSGTSIQVSDPEDSSSNLVNGVVLHVFSTSYGADGLKYYSYKSLTPGDLTISSSVFGGGTTTINTGTNTGIAVGDVVVVKHVENKVSVVPLATDETFTTPLLDNIFMDDFGLPYPYSQSVWAYWSLSGTNGTINKKGIGPNLTVTGNPSDTQALNGELGKTGFTGADYFSLTVADSQPVSGMPADALPLIMSIWYKPTAFTGTNRGVIDRYNPAGAAPGYRVYLAAGTNDVVLAHRGVLFTAAFTPGQWNHIIFMIKGDNSPNGIQAYSNGTLFANSNGTSTDSGSTFYVGYDQSGEQAVGVSLYSMLVIINSPDLTAGIASSIYNRGLGRLFNNAPYLSYQHSINGSVGQKVTLETTLNRTTDIASVFCGAHGITKA